MRIIWTEKETHALAGGIAALETLGEHVATNPDATCQARSKSMFADAGVLRELLGTKREESDR